MTPAIGERHSLSRIGLANVVHVLNMAWSFWPAQLLEGEKGFVDDRHRVPRRE
jgi:hypothetical protein